MKIARFAILAAAPALFGAYTYSYFDAFPTTTLDAAKWFLNGTVASLPGLNVSGAGGAVISKEFGPSATHEVRSS